MRHDLWDVTHSFTHHSCETRLIHSLITHVRRDSWIYLRRPVRRDSLIHSFMMHSFMNECVCVCVCECLMSQCLMSHVSHIHNSWDMTHLKAKHTQLIAAAGTWAPADATLSCETRLIDICDMTRETWLIRSKVYITTLIGAAETWAPDDMIIHVGHTSMSHVSQSCHMRLSRVTYSRVMSHIQESRLISKESKSAWYMRHDSWDMTHSFMIHSFMIERLKSKESKCPKCLSATQSHHPKAKPPNPKAKPPNPKAKPQTTQSRTHMAGQQHLCRIKIISMSWRGCANKKFKNQFATQFSMLVTNQQ